MPEFPVRSNSEREPFDWKASQKLPGIAVNPGTGPVDVSIDADERANENMRKLVEDAGFNPAFVEIERTGPVDEGRIPFTAKYHENEVQVDMPAIPLAEVRYTGEPDQNIWDFPRLYVQGSSWVWMFAVSQVQTVLAGGGDDDA